MRKSIILTVSMICFATAYSSDISEKIDAANSKIAAQLLKDNDMLDSDEVERLINPIIKNVLSRGKIFHEANDSSEAFEDLLHPTIPVGNELKPSPYFTYALEELIRSDVFKSGGIELKQRTSLFLLKKYNDKDFESHRRDILSFLMNYFTDPAAYNAEAVLVVKNSFLHEEIEDERCLYLLDMVAGIGDKEINHKLLAYAKECKNYDPKNIIPWVSLVLLAKNEDTWAITRLIEIASISSDASIGELQKAKFVFAYLALVPCKEVAELLRKYVANKNVIDQGRDVANRYVGISLFASETLAAIVDGYPVFSKGKYYQSDREVCETWLKQHPSLTLRKIDFTKENQSRDIRMLTGR